MDDRLSTSKLILACLTALLAIGQLCSPAMGQTIYEIWSPEINQTADSTFGTSLFRKKLSLIEPAEAEIYVSAKDNFELFINGQFVFVGKSTGQPFKFDVINFLQPGVNLFAIKVTHVDSVTAGLAVKFRVRESSENRWRSLTTNESWKTSTRSDENWFDLNLNESNWQNANKLASFQIATDAIVASQPMAQRPQPPSSPTTAQAENTELAANQTSESPIPTNGNNNRARSGSKGQPTKDSAAKNNNMNGRFTIDDEFRVEQVMLDEETGSLIAMAFNEFGNLILSREGGPLMIADVTKEPGQAGRIRTLCDDVTSCQGILPLNGKIFVTGDGPSGVALYQLFDSNRDGNFEVEKVVVPFAGELGEHGPHGIELGPDGLLYVTVGNASKSTTSVSKTSPYFHHYEGDLVERMEDPGGHAVGVEAPGGTIIRVALDGSNVERVAGGLRNIYDLTFDHYGELFLHDSDLETNLGMAWYRPTRIYHVPHGAELGWRSGWSKFPNYYADVTPPIYETGRGSPSGSILYQHFQFPARYHNAMFFADWSEGRILAATPKQKGAGYELDVEEFCSGRPMNVTDLSVGTDGTLFFCTGGRGTSGGVYRIAWNGVIPKELYSYDNDFERAIRMPQPTSAWGRQALATLRIQLKDTWGKALSGIATDHRNEDAYRMRAIDLLFFYGPFPDAEIISQLAADDNHNIRAKIAGICGIKEDDALNANLDQLISDNHPLVRRRAAESYFRLGQLPPVGKILAMLGSKDRTEALVARRLIERAPINSYQTNILKTEDTTTFVNGSLAILTAYPTLQSSYQILARVTHFMDGYLTDREFIDVLRVAQLALAQGNVRPSEISGFGERVAAEFPAGNPTINKQLALIMAFMKNVKIEDRAVQYFTTSDNPAPDKLYVAMMLQTVGRQLSEETRFAVLDYLETAFYLEEGTTYRNYIGTAIKELVQNGTRSDQIDLILKNGDRWPRAMLQSFFMLQERLSAERVDLVISADQKMRESDDTQTRKVRLGTIAMLAESKVPKAHEYLREIWQSRPEYRNEISLGLAQVPQGENWAYLVTSLPILDDTIGNEVVRTLRTVNRRPKKARQYRDLIELGFRLREDGALEVSRLMKHWTGEEIEQVSTSGQRWELAMNHWLSWYSNEWPSEAPVNVEPLAQMGQYSAERVLAHLEEFEIQGNPALGRLVFQKAQCNACHRVGSEGATFGPDLSNLAGRFSRREILESIIDPSKVVSDQYQSKKVLTVDGDQLFGMLVRDSSGDWLLQDTEGNTLRISDEEIEDIADSDKSSMPEGLLDSLSLDEILHLFAYLDRGRNQAQLSEKQEVDTSVLR